MNTAIRYDFRSDTVPAMRAAMAAVEVGDDVFGDDPAVRRLEARMADMLGKEAALFVPSATQSDLIALMAHCKRGGEYIVGQKAHCYRWDAGGAAALGGIQPQPLTHQADGTLLPADIEEAIKPDDPHFRTHAPARTREHGWREGSSAALLRCGNSRGPPAQACLPSGRRPRVQCGRGTRGCRSTRWPDRLTPSRCACPRGWGRRSARHSSLSAPLIAKGRRLRKMLGGGLRQSGIPAAAGLYRWTAMSSGSRTSMPTRSRRVCQRFRACPCPCRAPTSSS